MQRFSAHEENGAKKISASQKKLERNFDVRARIAVNLPKIPAAGKIKTRRAVSWFAPGARASARFNSRITGSFNCSVKLLREES